MPSATLTRADSGEPILIDYDNVEKMAPFMVQPKDAKGPNNKGTLGTAITMKDKSRVVVTEPEGAVTDAFKVAPEADESKWKENPNYTEPDEPAEVDLDYDDGDDDDD